ncbi:hypothetical protein H4Q32_030183 [Labeo rohita]|uniref:C2H2-type domain-containing protein n=1 Tax=Labeo rohita TaxID=84645 RepID=A0ABQ8ME27_LABRO|nr:hypothetical protein H4Q32_030183 [Labeo rohita]
MNVKVTKDYRCTGILRECVQQPIQLLYIGAQLTRRAINYYNMEFYRSCYCNSTCFCTCSLEAEHNNLSENALMPLKEECEVLNEMEEKEQYDFLTAEESLSWPQTFSQKTGAKSNFTPFHCEKSLNEHGNLEVQMKIHAEKKPFICQLCGISFTQKGNLKRHMRIHSGEKPYTCQQCGKSFTQKRILNRHMRIHAGEKPYTCQQCGKSFSRKGNLNFHMRVHTGENPFTCQQCGISFTHKGSLNRHMRIHTGEKPYTCQQCGKSFNRKGNLNYHMRVHTGENPFTCQQCGISFTQKGSLNRHMTKLHCIESTQS